MLDFSAIPVVDNHCHPILLRQQGDILRFRGFFTEAQHPSFAQTHLPNSVYYLWLVRQLAEFYGCEKTESAVVEYRNSLAVEDLVKRLYQGGNIGTLVLDLGLPLPEECYTAPQMSEMSQCRMATILRLETLMQRLIIEHGDFDEVIARFRDEVSNVRERGYVSFKSIVAYRTGLIVLEWSKDEAAASFAEAREQAVSTGKLRIKHKPLNDYLLHVAFAKAAEQQVPVQFHTGYGDSDTDMRLGNPLQLRDVFERVDYQTMPIILLHESYPYSQLGAYLAAIYPHVYFDLSYTIPFVDKLEMLAFTRQALSIAPASKLMYSSDGINIPEMHWVAAVRGRAILAQVLQEMIDADEIDEEQANRLGRQVLRDTAYTVYRL
jgi:uncharacterized protein